MSDSSQASRTASSCVHIMYIGTYVHMYLLDLLHGAWQPWQNCIPFCLLVSCVWDEIPEQRVLQEDWELRFDDWMWECRLGNWQEERGAREWKWESTLEKLQVVVSWEQSSCSLFLHLLVCISPVPCISEPWWQAGRQQEDITWYTGLEQPGRPSLFYLTWSMFQVEGAKPTK